MLPGSPRAQPVSTGFSADPAAPPPVAPPADPRARKRRAKVVETVMKALRTPDEPYALHGAEVAIRYCSPTNKASQLSPQNFAQYLREPWYAILTEWEEMEFQEEEEGLEIDDVQAMLAAADAAAIETEEQAINTTGNSNDVYISNNSTST